MMRSVGTRSPAMKDYSSAKVMTPIAIRRDRVKLKVSNRYESSRKNSGV